MLAISRQIVSAAFLFVTTASLQRMGSIVVAIGGMLMALDILGPQLTKLETYLTSLASKNTLDGVRERRLLNKLPTQRDVAGHLMGFLSYISVFFAYRESQRDWSGRRNLKRLLAEPAYFLLFLALVIGVTTGTAAISLMLFVLYLAFFCLDVAYWLLTSPYRIGLVLQRRYEWPHPLRNLGLLVFILGSIIYFLPLILSIWPFHTTMN